MVDLAARHARQRHLKRWPGLLQNLAKFRALLICQPGVRVCFDGIEDPRKVHLRRSPPSRPDRRSRDRDAAGAALEGSKTPESRLAWITHGRDAIQPLIVADPEKYAESAVAPQLDDLNVLLVHQRDPLGRTPAHRYGGEAREEGRR